MPLRELSLFGCYLTVLFHKFFCSIFVNYFVSVSSVFLADFNQNSELTYMPNLADFEAMRHKEQTLSEIFTELDTDRDGKIGAEELLSFCEDIGRVMTLEKAKKRYQTFRW